MNKIIKLFDGIVKEALPSVGFSQEFESDKNF